MWFSFGESKHAPDNRTPQQSELKCEARSFKREKREKLEIVDHQLPIPYNKCIGLLESTLSGTLAKLIGELLQSVQVEGDFGSDSVTSLFENSEFVVWGIPYS
ncbi:hypothetical protein TNIN_403341 [Trichonephila inaurata madagascariensis]|uniref:Uncharacterized protein n=1 Tax=Trichonephila inaurata madagascariensis TaxID=2747483 RepID=A0A8X6ISC1_9ARAC|nr:hypothetical protein TNIN_403341 [Trichonephila inaurata madagascariensis]